MVVHYAELLKAAELVAEQEEMRVNVEWSCKGAALTGAMTFAFGVLMGPLGMVAGGTLGGITSWAVSRGKFKSVLSIIEEDLTVEQRNKLAERVENAFKDFDVLSDVGPIVLFIASPRKNEILYMEIKNVVSRFMLEEIGKPVQFGNGSPMVNLVTSNQVSSK